MNNDLLAANLWAQIYANGELVNLFGDPELPLSKFLALAQPPVEVFLGLQDTGVWFATWFEPFMDGAFVSVYCTPELRRTRQLIDAYEWMLSCGLAQYSQLMSWTRRTKLLPVMGALGYTRCGVIPKIFAGADAYFCRVTQETFDRRAFVTQVDHPVVQGYK